jgi:hypothetical protein
MLVYADLLLRWPAGKRRTNEALCAHRPQPADPTDPGNAADLGTPQGFNSGTFVGLVKTPGEACDALFAQTIRKCGMHHSFGLRVATNFIVNVIYYGYDEARY